MLSFSPSLFAEVPEMQAFAVTLTQPPTRLLTSDEFNLSHHLNQMDVSPNEYKQL